MTNEGLRDAFMNELHGHGQDKFLVYKQLLGWKDVPDNGTGADDIAARKKALTNALRARIYMRRAGGNYEQYRREITNGYMRRSNEYPVDIPEAHRQMEYYRPVIFKRRNDEDSGSQHLLTEVIQKCFKCDRSKPECNGARNCRFDKKLDGSDVNL